MGLVISPVIERIAIIHVHGDDTESWLDQSSVVASIADIIRDLSRKPASPLSVSLVIEPLSVILDVRNFWWSETVMESKVYKLSNLLFKKT